MVQHGSANLTDTSRSFFPVGTALQYTCNPGYLLDGPRTVTCTTLGHWSSESPRCIHSDGNFLVTYNTSDVLMLGVR